ESEFFIKMAGLEEQRTALSGDNASKSSEFWLKAQIAFVKSFEEVTKTSKATLDENLKVNLAKQQEIIKKQKPTTDAVMKDQNKTFYEAIVKSKEFTEQQSDTLTTFVQDSAGVAITQFGGLVAAGENIGVAFRKTILASMFDIVSKSIDIYIPQILASAIGMLGPVAGTIAGFSAIGLVKGLLGVAKNAVTAFRGVVRLKGPGTQTSDDIPARLSVDESVVTARGTLAPGNEDALRWVNKTGGSLSDYFVKVKPELITNKLAITAQLEQKKLQLENQKVYFSIALERELEKKDKHSSMELRKIHDKLDITNDMLYQTIKQNEQLIKENKKLHSTFSSRQAIELSGNLTMDSNKISAEFQKSKIKKLSIVG
ncbi:MAG: hypothetical protein NTW25_00210, partial [Candidatus Kapabacteria bacterium]|nr:hypothetical protein [Candidatus Kapabacteria bacterium]